LKLVQQLIFDGKAGHSPLEIRKAIESIKEEARMKAMLRGICRGC
jgi:hypothetical protein